MDPLARTEVRVERGDAFMNTYRVFMRQRMGDQFYYGQTVVLTQADPGTMLDPMLTLPEDTAQMLMDELWRAGLRPSEGSGSAGSLAATERHLKDMRALLAHSIGETL